MEAPYNMCVCVCVIFTRVPPSPAQHGRDRPKPATTMPKSSQFMAYASHVQRNNTPIYGLHRLNCLFAHFHLHQLQSPTLCTACSCARVRRHCERRGGNPFCAPRAHTIASQKPHEICMKPEAIEWCTDNRSKCMPKHFFRTVKHFEMPSTTDISMRNAVVQFCQAYFRCSFSFHCCLSNWLLSRLTRPRRQWESIVLVDRGNSSGAVQ